MKLTDNFIGQVASPYDAGSEKSDLLYFSLSLNPYFLRLPCAYISGNVAIDSHYSGVTTSVTKMFKRKKIGDVVSSLIFENLSLLQSG